MDSVVRESATRVVATFRDHDVADGFVDTVGIFFEVMEYMPALKWSGIRCAKWLNDSQKKGMVREMVKAWGICGHGTYDGPCEGWKLDGEKRNGAKGGDKWPVVQWSLDTGGIEPPIWRSLPRMQNRVWDRAMYKFSGAGLTKDEQAMVRKHTRAGELNCDIDDLSLTRLAKLHGQGDYVFTILFIEGFIQERHMRLA